MLSVFNSAFVLAAEEAAGASHTLHMDAVLVGAAMFAALMLAMLVTMSFGNVAHRHPETPVRVDPHRQVHARPSKH